jgi:hypothetical protein
VIFREDRDPFTRVGGAEESFGAIDIAPLDCPDKPGNDGVGN